MNFAFTLWRWLTGPRSLFFLLPAFMAVLIAGTLAQKDMGLFPATHTFFYAWIIWFGKLPLPGGLLLLTLIALNTILHFITTSQWNKKQIGATLVHLGVILLLIGGAMSLYMKREGFVVLRHGLPTATMIDYHDRILTILQNGKTKQIMTQDNLFDGMELWKGIKIDKVLRNSQPAENISKDQKCIGLACEYRLDSITPKAEDEANQMGLVFSIDGNRAFVTEFMNPSLDVIRDKDRITIFFQRATELLPFEITLNRFEQATHPGSDMAKSYRSDVTLMMGGKRHDATIEMNSPLRQKHFTLYQTSVLALPNGETASVLNVVQNRAWLFPYAASLLLLIGFIIHMVNRRDATA